MASSLSKKIKPIASSLAERGEDCTITFGHNVSIQKVMMQFSGPVHRLILSPQDARNVALRLKEYADLAEGKKAM